MGPALLLAIELAASTGVSAVVADGGSVSGDDETRLGVGPAVDVGWQVHRHVSIGARLQLFVVDANHCDRRPFGGWCREADLVTRALAGAEAHGGARLTWTAAVRAGWQRLTWEDILDPGPIMNPVNTANVPSDHLVVTAAAGAGWALDRRFSLFAEAQVARSLVELGDPGPSEDTVTTFDVMLGLRYAR